VQRTAFFICMVSGDAVAKEKDENQATTASQ
jgi:hypothetical protein